MQKTNCMTYFMTGNKSYQLSHQFFVKYCMSGFRINRTNLYDMPLVQELHDVVIPTDMCLDDLPASRVVNLWSVCIPDIRRKIIDKTVPSVINLHSRIILWPFLSENCIFKTCLLKCFLPIIDA